MKKVIITLLVTVFIVFSSFTSCFASNWKWICSTNTSTYSYDTESIKRSTASTKVASLLMGTMTEVNNAYAAKVRSCGLLNNTTLKTAKFSAITAIEGNAFKGCTELTSFNLPSTLTTIASTAFDGCVALTNITIHKGTDSITGSPWGATNATVTWTGDTPTNVYDDTVTDINGYMRYADQKFNFVSDSPDLTSNAVTYFMAEANTAYTITMGMDTRFRAWSYNGMPASSGLVMSNYVIHSLDDNTSTSQNGATETLTITTGASDDRVFIGYWSKGGSVERLNVRNTSTMDRIETEAKSAGSAINDARGEVENAEAFIGRAQDAVESGQRAAEKVSDGISECQELASESRKLNTDIAKILRDIEAANRKRTQDSEKSPVAK